MGGEHRRDRYRRGLYIHFQRTAPYPQLMNFDAPSASLSCTRRERTDTPLQALNLMNDPVFFEAAQGLAFRIMREIQPAASATASTTPSRSRSAASPRAREAERLGKYFDETSRNLAARSEDRDGAVSRTSWKACRRPKPRPGWS